MNSPKKRFVVFQSNSDSRMSGCFLIKKQQTNKHKTGKSASLLPLINLNIFYDSLYELYFKLFKMHFHSFRNWSSFVNVKMC